MSDYPSLTKSYQYNVNQAIVNNGPALSTSQNMIWAIYQALIGFTLFPWTVVSSNNFGSAAALVANSNGSAHSWIVLKQVGVSANFQILITLTGNFTISVLMSPSVGFTGGTTLLDPTASDSVPILTGANFGTAGGLSFTQPYKLHVMQSTDGAVTRGFITAASGSSGVSVCLGFFSFEQPQNPVTGWTNPCVGTWVASTSADILTGNALNTTASAQGRGVSTMALFWTGEASNNVLVNKVLAVPNDLNQEWPQLPVGLFSTTASNRGRHGSLYDVWWGAYNLPTGTQYVGTVASVASQPYGFAQFGTIVVPWNGTLLQVA